MTNDYLHVYAQKRPHDEVQIIGDAGELKKLSDVILLAVKNKQVGSLRESCVDGFYCIDGEEYSIRVTACDNTRLYDTPYEGYDVEK